MEPPLEYDPNADLGWQEGASHDSSYAGFDEDAHYDYGTETLDFSSYCILDDWRNPEAFHCQTEPLVGPFDYAPFDYAASELPEPVDPEQKGTPRFSCPDCPASYRHEQDLGSHRRDAHGYKSLEPPQQSPSPHQVSQKDQKAVHRCDSCETSFKRRADLKRHHDVVHNGNSLAKIFCDYKRCGRHKDGFSRKDHFRDHLRNFHGEHIERRAAGASNMNDSLVVTPNPRSNWWRCGKCFKRVKDEEGADCPTCDTRARSRSPGRRSSRNP